MKTDNKRARYWKWPSQGAFVDHIVAGLQWERESTAERWRFWSAEEIDKELDRYREQLRHYLNMNARPPIARYESEGERKLDGFVVNTMNLQLEDGTRLPFTLGMPSRPLSPPRIVIALHGTNESMEYPLGNLIGPARRGHENVPGFARPLLEAGYYVVSPDLPSFGRRLEPIEQYAQLAMLTGSSYLEKAVGEVSTLIDWIKSNPELNAYTLGIVGFSLGGQVAVATAACDLRIDSVIDIGGWSTYETVFRLEPDMIAKRVYICGSGFLGVLGDMWRLAAAIAPRPILRIAAEEDEYNPLAGVRDTMALLSHIYAAHGSDELLRLYVHPGIHDVAPQTPQQLVEWFNETM
ncbi:MAG: alpha/beta fold hydrolase [Paenibacillaceae bacterium]|nr:alpha/beta fold hydrolase [Paenibacillaceae bacterium]